MTSSSTSLPKLLVLSSTYPRWKDDSEPGFTHALCSRLATTFEVHVVCPHAPDTPIESTMNGIYIHRFRYAPAILETLVQGGGIVNNLKHHLWKWLLLPSFFIGLGWKTWKISRDIRPDCIHAHWIIPQGLILSAIQGMQRRAVPFLLTSHGGDLYGLKGPVFDKLKCFVLRRASAITVVSNAMLHEALRLGAAPETCTVLPMGVDFEGLFTPGAIEERQAGEILFVGRLVEKKGLRYLLEAMPEVLADSAHAHLTIAGFGPEEPALRILAQQLNITRHVTFLGAIPQSELPSLYQRATLFVAPFIEAADGDKEGLGLVTVEALACGCPVIVGDMPVLDDILSPAESDLRVDPRQREILARRINKALASPVQGYERALEIRQRLILTMGWPSIANSYAKLLRSLI